MLVTLPAYPSAPSEVTWKLRQPSQANRSEFTGLRRVTVLAEAPRWTAQVKYHSIRGEDRFLPWRAALASMQGRAGTFRLRASEQPQLGLYGGRQVVVDGAGQIGTSINTRNWAPGNYLKAGWFITVSDRLHQVTALSVAGADGKMAIHVMPACAGHPDGRFVEVTRPYGLMALSDDEAGWTVGAGQRYELSFACEEAL